MANILDFVMGKMLAEIGVHSSCCMHTPPFVRSRVRAVMNRNTHQNIILRLLLAFDLFDLGSALFQEAGCSRGLCRVHHRASSRV